MKKVVFFLLGVTFSLSICAATSNFVSETIFNDVFNTNLNKNKPVNSKLDLGEDLGDGGLRDNSGEYVISVYQYAGYLQVVIDRPDAYTITIENSFGELYYSGSASSSQSTVNIPTMFFPEDSYIIRISNGTSSLSGGFTIE